MLSEIQEAPADSEVSVHDEEYLAVIEDQQSKYFRQQHDSLKQKLSRISAHYSKQQGLNQPAQQEFLDDVMNAIEEEQVVYTHIRKRRYKEKYGKAKPEVIKA